MAHTLSIIIPVYNTSAFLEKCVESVLKQNVEMEIILIDDGSTDDSPALCDRLALCDARIKVIHQANSGISSARNRALDICKGKYITFVDSDDELLEDTYKPNLEILEQNEHITVVQFPYIYPYNQPNPRKGADSAQMWECERDILEACMSPEVNHAIWNKIFRRAVFDQLRFPEGTVFEDTYIIPDLAKRIGCLYSSGLGGYGYNLRPGSIMASGSNPQKMQERFQAYERIVHAASGYPDLHNSPLFVNYYHQCFLMMVGINRTPKKISSRYEDSLNRFRTISCSLSSIFRTKNLPVKEGEPGEVTITTLGVEGMPLFLKISYLCGRHPKVLSIKDSLSYILKHRISISRYGDGEILLMEGYPIGFQKEDAALATRLREIARNPIPQHRVCIPDVFSGISSYNKESRKFWKDFLFRGNGLTLFNKYFQSGPYLNTQISRFYEHLKDKTETPQYISLWRQIFHNRHLILVEGTGSKLGFHNDLFEGAASIRRIVCPAENAFNYYHAILETTLDKAKGMDLLVLIALGPTATVLAHTRSTIY